jgi:hypothetical protein
MPSSSPSPHLADSRLKVCVHQGGHPHLAAGLRVRPISEGTQSSRQRPTWDPSRQDTSSSL